jgi:hypothetical protein
VYVCTLTKIYGRNRALKLLKKRCCKRRDSQGYFELYIFVCVCVCVCVRIVNICADLHEFLMNWIKVTGTMLVGTMLTGKSAGNIH